MDPKYHSKLKYLKTNSLQQNSSVGDWFLLHADSNVDLAMQLMDMTWSQKQKIAVYEDRIYQVYRYPKLWAKQAGKWQIIHRTEWCEDK